MLLVHGLAQCWVEFVEKVSESAQFTAEIHYNFDIFFREAGAAGWNDLLLQPSDLTQIHTAVCSWTDVLL
jgi:hypothetical protein